MFDPHEALGVYAGSAVVGAVSAVVPVINAEVYIAAMVVLVGSGVKEAIAIGTLLALGQMAGKCAIYGAARGGSSLRKPRETTKSSWMQRLATRWRDRPQLLMFLSATASVPPYLMVVALAGAMKIR